MVTATAPGGWPGVAPALLMAVTAAAVAAPNGGRGAAVGTRSGGAVAAGCTGAAGADAAAANGACAAAGEASGTCGERKAEPPGMRAVRASMGL